MGAIEIELSKRKTMLLLLGAVAFVAIGILFVTKPEGFNTPITRNKTLTVTLGLLSILFFGACFIYGLIKLFDKKAGLIMDENGITDNSNATSIGFIAWEDILSIDTRQVASTRFLLITVKNPEEYLERATGLKRRLLEANMRYYRTPLSITSTSLKYNFDDLEQLIRSCFTKYRQP